MLITRPDPRELELFRQGYGKSVVTWPGWRLGLLILSWAFEDWRYR